MSFRTPQIQAPSSRRYQPLPLLLPASNTGRGAAPAPAPANSVPLPVGALSPSRRRRSSLDLDIEAASASGLGRARSRAELRRSWRRSSFYGRALWAWHEVCLFPADSSEDDDDDEDEGRPASNACWAPSAEPPEDEDIENAEISFKEDVYDAVLAAAFGGVRMQLDGPGVTRVHPFFLLLLLFPLVCVQFALTFCVSLNIDFRAKVASHEQGEEGMEVTIKIVLVIILQMMFFDRMLSNVRLLLFALNPTSWTDINRPARTGSRTSWVYYLPAMVTPALGALLLKFAMQYYVNIVSTSIVLASQGLKEAIFDSLAISFIVDLDMTLWAFVKTILHLDDIGDFTLNLWPKADRRHMMRFWPGPCRSLFRVKFLHRGHGARRFENLLSFGLMFALYFRLTMNVLYALKTNVVPAARDVCLQWRWLTGHPRKRWLSAWIFRVTVHTLLFPFRNWWTPEAQVSQRAKEFCNKEHYADTSQDHYHDIVMHYRKVTLFTCLVLSALLLVPELFLAKGSTLQFFLKAFRAPALDEESDDQAMSEVHHHDFAVRSTKHISMKVDDLHKMRTDMQHLRAQLQAMQSRFDLHGLR